MKAVHGRLQQFPACMSTLFHFSSRTNILRGDPHRGWDSETHEWDTECTHTHTHTHTHTQQNNRDKAQPLTRSRCSTLPGQAKTPPCQLVGRLALATPCADVTRKQKVIVDCFTNGLILPLCRFKLPNLSFNMRICFDSKLDLRQQA